jgi:acetylornithine deacetylase/succinyl-diaminopimelate desuccinylase-like protein
MNIKKITIFLILFGTLLFSNPNWDKVQIETIRLFQEYIQIDTSNPPGDVTKAVQWFAEIFDQENISYETFVVDEDPRRMHILAELKGSNSNLKPLLLLNHIDVVPADASLWKADPFQAEIIDGVIYGRGALDMKCLGIMQLMSLILLKREGYIPERTIKFLGVADEEILGKYGVQWMIENHWDKLNPEWVWDEGGIGSTDSFPNLSAFAIAVAQRKSFWVDVEVVGKSGHGSRPFKDYSNEILAKALNNIVSWETSIDVNPVIAEMFYRIGNHMGGFEGFVMKNIDNSLIKYFFGNTVASSSTSTNAMLRNTVALTMIESGYKTNIIPEKAKASLDIRLLPHINPDNFLDDLKSVVDDDRVKFIPKRTPTNNFVSNWDTDFFSILSEELNYEKQNALVIPFMTIGGTDSQFFQEKGVDCYGIIPVMVSEEDIQTMHGIDERLSIKNLIMGTKIVYKTVKKSCKK